MNTGMTLKRTESGAKRARFAIKSRACWNVWGFRDAASHVNQSQRVELVDILLITSTRTSILIILGDMAGTSLRRLFNLTRTRKTASDHTLIFEDALSIADISSCWI